MKVVIEVSRHEGSHKIILGGETQVEGTADDILCWLAGLNRTGSVQVDVLMAEPTENERLYKIYRAALIARYDANRG